MKRLLRAVCLVLCWTLLMAGMPGKASAEEAAPMVRVLLRRLQLTDRADLTLAGAYTVRVGGEDLMALPENAQVTVQIRSGALYLFYDGMSMRLGKSAEFRRNQSSSAMPGLRFEKNGNLYPGSLTLTVENGTLVPILSLSVEDYLLGVVPYEMSDSFPLEALKAQAVCARTYALSHLNASRAYDVVDTTNDQVFKGVDSSTKNAARAVQRAQPGNDRTFRPCFYPAAHLCQNFQQRCIGLRPAAGQFHPTSCRRAGTGKGGCHDAVGHGRKAAAIQHSSALHPDGAGARALYTAAAAVQECCQIADLRFSCGPAQDRLALRRSCCQKQGLGSTHAGEPKCDVRTVQPGRRCQDQPCPLLPAVHAHLRKAGKVQVHRPCTNAAPAGQHRFHPAKPRQKRCAEQNGCPHPRGGFRRKAAGGRHALHRDVAALPAGRAARTLQKLHAGVHIRKMRHLQKTHRAIAQKGRCQQRQHAVFGCRDVYCAVQRHAACDDKISAHAKSPRSAKDTSCYAARRLFVYFVCSCAICLSGHL